MNEELGDQEAREQIINCLDRNLFVEAAAGSGKTASLVARMAALISNGTCNIDEIASITFTRKAAGQLRERFQLELEKNFRSANEPIKRQRLRKALDQIDACYIGTIHSFCSSLLRERPVEAGVSPDFNEIEGLEERLLEKRAWEEYLLNLKLEKPEVFKELEDADLSPPILFQAYQTLNLYPDVEFPFAVTKFPNIGQIPREVLMDVVSLAAPFIPPYEPEKGWDALQSKIRTVLRRSRFFDLDNDLIFLRLLEDLDRNKPRITQKRWLSSQGAKDSLVAYEDFQIGYLEPILKEWREYRYSVVLSFVLPACEYYRKLRIHENCLNFQDLLMRCAEFLKVNDELRYYFRQRYRRILIDEFQDTDPIQAEIMLYLTGTDLQEQNWTRLIPEAGSLFVVGDPQQSIYRFRRADIDTFYQIRSIIENSGGLVVNLSSNFRSVPEILDWINPSFIELFSLMGTPYQAGYMEMNKHRDNSIANTSGVLVMDLPPKSKPSQDAIQIAWWIKSALNGAIQIERTDDEICSGLDSRLVPSDFLILLHYKKDMAEYARALESAGIPYYIAGANDLSSSYYARELLYLLKAISDPGDPVALVAALRGAFFGISDQCLYDFKKSGGVFNFVMNVTNTPSDALQTLAEAFLKLKQYWSWSCELPASSSLERIIEDLGVIPIALADSEGNSQAAAIIQVIEIIRLQEQQGNVHFPDIVDYWETLLNEGLEEEVSLEGNRKQGVRLMNLHKAKGLEAPVVILANPWHRSSREPDLHVSRKTGNPKAYLQIKRSSTNSFFSYTIATPADWDKYIAEEGYYAQAEDIRLLYVACTRAKNLLVITRNPDRRYKSPWFPLEEYLSAATIINASPPEPSVITGASLVETFLDSRLQRAEKLEFGSQPSYLHTSVTERVKVGLEEPERFTTGKGKSWGSVIHEALEKLAHEQALLEDNEWVEEILTRNGRLVKEIEEAKEMLCKIFKTPLWLRIQQSDQVLTEVPFGAWDKDTYITGTIDLVFKDNDGWHIIDYKTDSIKDDSHKKQLLDYYQPQVDLYKTYWEKVTGEIVVTAQISLINDLIG